MNGMQKLPGIRFLGRKRLLGCRPPSDLGDQDDGPAGRLCGRRQRRVRPRAAESRHRAGDPYPGGQHGRPADGADQSPAAVPNLEWLDERWTSSAVDADPTGTPMSLKDIGHGELDRGRVGRRLHHDDDVVTRNGARKNLGKGADLVLEPSPLHLAPLYPRPRCASHSTRNAHRVTIPTCLPRIGRFEA